MESWATAAPSPTVAWLPLLMFARGDWAAVREVWHAAPLLRPLLALRAHEFPYEARRRLASFVALPPGQWVRGTRVAGRASVEAARLYTVWQTRSGRVRSRRGREGPLERIVAVLRPEAPLPAGLLRITAKGLDLGLVWLVRTAALGSALLALEAGGVTCGSY